MTADPTRGLYGKYLVERVDGKPLKGGRCIVLEVGDPNAWPALWEWADTVDDAGYAALAADVRRMLHGVDPSRCASGHLPASCGCGQPPSDTTSGVMGERYCPCNGACHVEGDNPCSIDCFAHHDDMHTVVGGYVHALVKPGGECLTDCPHPAHSCNGGAA